MPAGDTQKRRSTENSSEISARRRRVQKQCSLLLEFPGPLAGGPIIQRFISRRRKGFDNPSHSVKIDGMESTGLGEKILTIHLIPRKVPEF